MWCGAAQAAPFDVTADVLPSAQIVIVGELHDNAAHHENQAAIARTLAPKAMVFEMLTPEQASAGQNAPRNDQAVLDVALGWSETSWPDFTMYFPIFSAAPEAKLYGATLDRDIVRASVGTGAAAQLNDPRFGLETPLAPDEQEQRETLQSDAHCNALPPEMLGGMVEAQRLRDAHFAKVALQALEDTGGPVLVITGNGHARKDWGMPRFLKRVAPTVRVISVGQLTQEGQHEQFDRWIITGAYTPKNGDPCAAFKSN